MADLSSIVSVTVSTQGAGLSQPGFGTLLIAAPASFPERVRFYTSLSGLVADGFSVNSAAYKAAAVAFAQSPRPERVAIGRLANLPDLEVRVTPTVANSQVYSFLLTGPTGASATISFTSDATATLAEILTGLTSAATTAAIPEVTVVNDSTHLTIKADAAGKFLSVNPGSSLLTVKQNHADAGLTADLTAILLESNDFFALALTTAGAAEVTAAATWAEANKKLFFASTQDSEVKGASGGIIETLKSANREFTTVIFNEAGDSFPGVAWAADTLPIDPGGVTFAYRSLSGVVASPLTETERGNILNDNGNAVVSFSNLSRVVQGKVASGEWVDIVRDREWYISRLQVEIGNLLLRTDKVPYTDAGVALIENVVRAVVREAEVAGFLAPGESIFNIPKVAAVSSGDRSARRFGPIQIESRVAGAIHFAYLQVTLAV